MPKPVYILFVIAFLCRCTTKREHTVSENAKVYIMYAPDCPLCKNYTLDIKNLIDVYGSYIDFIAVIPGTHYSEAEVDSFFNYYSLDINVLYDRDMNLVNDFGASITPEVFFVGESNKVLYQGKFDNWLGELGRRRQIVTEYYLRDAIVAHLNNEKVKIKKTTAIGCFIE